MESDHPTVRTVAAHWLDFSIFFYIFCFLGGFIGLPLIWILVLAAILGVLISIFVSACSYAIFGGVFSEWLWGVKLANDSAKNPFAAYVAARFQQDNPKIQFVTHKHSGWKDFIGSVLCILIIVIFFVF